MKQIYVLAILFFGMANTAVTAQETTSPWSFEVGVNAVDVYPVGEDATTAQGDYFNEFFNVNDHWNLGGFNFGATRSLGKHLSATATLSVNEISKWGETATEESALVGNSEYFGIDAMLNYAFGSGKLQPFISAGAGYTWIGEDRFNTYALESGDDDEVGAGTLNGGVGLKYALSERFGLKFQATYKHSFEDYLTKHFQHTLGVTYKLGKIIPPVVPVIDTDGDGVADENDLCPDVAGLKEFAGCPDSDGDGVPNSLDKCADNETGTGKGCKEPVKTIEVPVAPSTLSKIVYFDTDKADLDNNSKAIIGDIVKLSENGSQYSIAVSGYTDTVGGANYNKSLSLKRANAVKEYLASRGISVNNITIESYGEEKPAAPNTTREGKSLNRRAELTINVTSK